MAICLSNKWEFEVKEGGGFLNLGHRAFFASNKAHTIPSITYTPCESCGTAYAASVCPDDYYV